MGGDDLGMVQAHHIYCALFSIIIISPPSQIIRHRSQRLGTPILNSVCSFLSSDIVNTDLTVWLHLVSQTRETKKRW